MHQYFVYILTNTSNKVLYTGVTNDLIRRVWQHKNKLADGFTKQYNVDKLVFYEATTDVHSAISREKQLKGGSRAQKIRLIDQMNPTWTDLYYQISPF